MLPALLRPDIEPVLQATVLLQPGMEPTRQITRVSSSGHQLIEPVRQAIGFTSSGHGTDTASGPMASSIFPQPPNLFYCSSAACRGTVCAYLWRQTQSAPLLVGKWIFKLDSATTRRYGATLKAGTQTVLFLVVSFSVLRKDKFK